MVEERSQSRIRNKACKPRQHADLCGRCYIDPKIQNAIYTVEEDTRLDS